MGGAEGDTHPAQLDANPGSLTKAADSLTVAWR
jgi:hypothetical protein